MIYIYIYSYCMRLLSKYHSRNSPPLGLQYKCWYQRDPAKWRPEATRIYRPCSGEEPQDSPAG